MAKVGMEDPRWIVTDMSNMQDKHNVNKWYSSERDMLKEGHARLSKMFGGLSLELEPASACESSVWEAQITCLSACDGEIIFFDRTVNGVRKPTTVVDVQLVFAWEAVAGSLKVHGTATCAELSGEALSEGLRIETRMGSGAAAFATTASAEAFQR
eukprot:COSAG05_NODE_9907_length_594_cov_1.040404_1_plen_155_part_10